jgi:hypothetical protein
VRAGLAILTIVAVTSLVRVAPAQMLITLRAPHAVRDPKAIVDDGLLERIDARAAAAKIETPEQLVAFALHETGSMLHFGLAHPTRLRFDATDREGNCVEYAELLATVLNRERAQLHARAWVVRSDARLLGHAIVDPAWKDHDWVLLVVHSTDGTRRLYVDPTLDDMGLGWDLSRAVRGDVRVGSDPADVR